MKRKKVRTVIVDKNNRQAFVTFEDKAVGMIDDWGIIEKIRKRINPVETVDDIEFYYIED